MFALDEELGRVRKVQRNNTDEIRDVTSGAYYTETFVQDIYNH